MSAKHTDAQRQNQPPGSQTSSLDVVCRRSARQDDTAARRQVGVVTILKCMQFIVARGGHQDTGHHSTKVATKLAAKLDNRVMLFLLELIDCVHAAAAVLCAVIGDSTLHESAPQHRTRGVTTSCATTESPPNISSNKHVVDRGSVDLMKNRQYHILAFLLRHQSFESTPVKSSEIAEGSVASES